MKIEKKPMHWVFPAAILIIVLLVIVLDARDDMRDNEDKQNVNIEDAALDARTALVGTYVSGMLPAASTAGRSFTLLLEEDGKATFTADYQTEDPAVVDTGDWVQADNGVKVTLTTRFRMLMAEPVVMNFNNVDGELVLFDYDLSRWGDLGLTLTHAE